MDGYTKAAIKEALATRSPRQIKFDEVMERVVNGPAKPPIKDFACLIANKSESFVIDMRDTNA
jgi:hypothetical protein